MDGRRRGRASGSDRAATRAGPDAAHQPGHAAPALDLTWQGASERLRLGLGLGLCHLDVRACARAAHLSPSTASASSDMKGAAGSPADSTADAVAGPTPCTRAAWPSVRPCEGGQGRATRDRRALEMPWRSGRPVWAYGPDLLRRAPAQSQGCRAGSPSGPSARSRRRAGRPRSPRTPWPGPRTRPCWPPQQRHSATRPQAPAAAAATCRAGASTSSAPRAHASLSG